MKATHHRHPEPGEALLWRRRQAIALGAGGLVTLTTLAACGPSGQPAETKKEEAGPGQAQQPAMPGTFKEAPQLAQLVKEGKLPPVAQRLPREPIVIKPWERTGQYGGTWRMVTTGRSDDALWTRSVRYEGLVRWDPEWKSIIPNLATRWEVNANATEFTFYLREGVKWSDGKPLTADDFVYWLEDVAKNPELSRNLVPGWMRVGGQAPNIVKLGEYAFKYVYPAPHGLLMQRLATPDAVGIYQPAHWAKQWHKKYAQDSGIQAEIARKQKLIEEEQKRRGLPGDYMSFYEIMLDVVFTPERPVANAWKVSRGVGEGQTVLFERNPFYWKVDADGNQLPYLDRVQAEQHEKVETMVLRALNGEIDFQDRHIATLSNKSVFVDGQQKGGYKLYETVPSSMNSQVIALNLSHKDPETRKIFQDRRFRVALSHAINRKEAIELLYVGQGAPAQASPLKESAFYSERMATQYLEYNPTRANQILDEMGLSRKDGRGMRLRFDGKPLFIAFEVASSSTESVDYLQLVKKYWAAVGVDMEPKVEDRSIFYTRKEANEHDAAIWGGDGGMEVLLEPRWYFPYSFESNFATAWANWYMTGGQQGDEPAEAAKKQMDLYKQVLGTADEKRQTDLMKQIIDIATEEFWTIGLSRNVRGYGIQRNDFQNMPKTLLGGWLYPGPGPINPPQFFTTRK